MELWNFHLAELLTGVVLRLGGEFESEYRYL